MNKYHNYKSQALALAVTVTLFTGANAFADSSKYQFDISRQSLAEALVEFSNKTNIAVLYGDGVKADQIMLSVAGEYSPEEALGKMLQGTGLHFKKVEENVFLVIDAGDGAEIDKSEKSSSADVLTKSSSEKQNLLLEEVTVTAQKRSESIQDIPIAISAFSQDDMERAGVAGIEDLKQLAPSLQFGQQSIDTFVAIRGIGHEVANIGAEAGVTISQDGVPFSNQVLFDADFFDVERVEVLRGPQGTISGRNATGGAINVYSKLPTDEFQGHIKTTIGNYSRFGVEGSVSGPIADEHLLGRLSVRSERADGWLKNTFRNEEHNDVDKVQVRGSLVADLSANLEASLILEGMVDRSSPVSSVDLGRARPDVPGFAESQGVPGFDWDALEYQADFPDTRRVEAYKSALKLSWNLGDSSTLTSTTGYAAYEQTGTDDFDATIINRDPFSATDVDLSQLSQELTLTADLSDRLDMILGIMYLGSRAKETVILGSPSTGLPEGALDLRSDQDLNSYAAYTQWRYRLTDNLRISAGARYTYDKKDLSENIVILGSASSGATSKSWQAFTPRFAIDYIPTDDLTLYVSISRGFKAGGFNTFSAISASPDDFDPEFVWNYETGVKANWLDRRLRTVLTGFYMEYKGLQQSLLLVPEGSAAPVIEVKNAGEATVKGIELELDAYITDQFKFSASGTWLDATYDNLLSGDQIYPELGELDATGNRIRDLSGNRLVRAPEFQFNVSAEYTAAIQNNWQAVFRADYQWQDDVFFSFLNHELNSQSAYGLLNLFGTVETMDGNWQLTLFMHNALDERYVSSSYTFLFPTPLRLGLVGSPRTYGASFTYRF